MIGNACTTGCYGHAAGTQAALVLQMHRTLECFPIQVHLHSYDLKAPLGLLVASCSLYSDQIASESSLAARGREHMGPRPASSCVNATPECWARPGSHSTPSTPDDEERSLILMQMGGAPHTKLFTTCRTVLWYLPMALLFVYCSTTSHSASPQPLYTYHTSRRTLIIDRPQYWTMRHCFVGSSVLKGLQSCGLRSWFHICPSGQMLRSRPFGNHANIPHQRKYASSAVKPLTGKRLRK